MDHPISNSNKTCLDSIIYIEKQIKRVIALRDYEDNPTNITKYVLESTEQCTYDDFPTWEINRFGMSCTKLDDGRIIFIAGEHEDYYDPNFFIYNDVIVINGKDITIYGYPTSIFPPTDFHETIKIGNKLWIIGSLGYLIDRNLNNNIQVCCLDIETMKINKVETNGNAPKWMWFKKTENNKCFLENEKIIVVNNDNEKWSLDTNTLHWTKLV
jgi:hypothetical protein